MPRILLIDDQQDFHDIHETVLTAHGYEVDHAFSAEEGLGKIAAACPDVVILDIMMPDGYEGFEVARAVRFQLKLTDLPIIVLSSIHEVKQMTARFGIDENHLPVNLWLDKPVEPRDLLEKIRTALCDQEPLPG
jgi:DNA-binding response OmpR family regulator